MTASKGDSSGDIYDTLQNRTNKKRLIDQCLEVKRSSPPSRDLSSGFKFAIAAMPVLLVSLSFNVGKFAGEKVAYKEIRENIHLERVLTNGTEYLSVQIKDNRVKFYPTNGKYVPLKELEGEIK